ncbi:MAG: hypothetical protein GY775_03260 [Candidatus Scalindua sp.]|nr:hypothetical protein [Candidatus Scalindua sp.]
MSNYEFYVYNSSNYQAGCHHWQSNVVLLTDARWTSNGASLIHFIDNGTILDRGGSILGTWKQETWYKVKIIYDRDGSNVNLSYWIDDFFIGTRSFPAASYEDNLLYFGFNSGDGTVWYDDISTSPLSYEDILISPAKGGNAGQVTVKVYGHGFTEGTTVKLVKDSNEITGKNTNVERNSKLTTTFDLVGATPGMWDLIVTLPDNSQQTCEDCFTVEEGGEAKLWVNIIGRPIIRAGRQFTYIISYGNNGNVDAIGVPLFISYPKSGVNIDIKINPPSIEGDVPDWDSIPDQIELGDRIFVPVIIPILGASSVAFKEFKLTSSTQIDNFDISVFISPPLFHQTSDNQLQSMLHTNSNSSIFWNPDGVQIL